MQLRASESKRKIQRLFLERVCNTRTGAQYFGYSSVAGNIRTLISIWGIIHGGLDTLKQ